MTNEQQQTQDFLSSLPKHTCPKCKTDLIPGIFVSMGSEYREWEHFNNGDVVYSCPNHYYTEGLTFEEAMKLYSPEQFSTDKLNK